ncbi:hypothetical protein ACH4MM_05915 [Streptomyces pratensis]
MPTETRPGLRNAEAHSWAPQMAILEQEDAFVTHAGMGGCDEGPLAGLT